MKALIRLIILLAAGITLMQPSPAHAHQMRIERFGLYVLVEDVERASGFYERLFGAAPQVRTPTLVGFDVAGGLYAVASKRAYAPEAEGRGLVRPYIKVGDIFAAFAHARSVAPGHLQTDSVVEEGPFKFFRMTDPERNVIEFFSFAPQPRP